MTAVAACLVGIAVFGAAVAGLVLIGLAAIARFRSFFLDEDFTHSRVWAWAPGGVLVGSLSVVVLTLLSVFWFYWRGAGRQVIAEVRAEPADRIRHRQFLNIVEELAIGIGRTPPTLLMVADPVPNALSVRTSSGRTLILTEGCNTLPRDQIEALCAHEFGHLWARDAHWVTSGMVALARARKLSGWLTTAGAVVVFLVIGLAWHSDLEIVLWSTGLIGLAAAILGMIAHLPLRRLEVAVRRDADQIADVVAIKLARNPQALGELCDRLSRDERHVEHVGWRSELLWFEAIEVMPSTPRALMLLSDSDDGAAEAAQLREQAAREIALELGRRADAAYAAAGVPRNRR